MKQATDGASMEDLKQETQRAWTQASDYAERTLEDGKEVIRSNPLPTIFGAFAIGFAIALLIPGRKAPPMRSSLESCLGELKERLHSTGATVSGLTEKTCGNASSALESALKKAKSALSFL